MCKIITSSHTLSERVKNIKKLTYICLSFTSIVLTSDIRAMDDIFGCCQLDEETHSVTRRPIKVIDENTEKRDYWDIDPNSWYFPFFNAIGCIEEVEIGDVGGAKGLARDLEGREAQQKEERKAGARMGKKYLEKYAEPIKEAVDDGKELLRIKEKKVKRRNSKY